MKFDTVFIFNTGRCGSQSIAKSLNTINEISAVHEPQPVLARENILKWLDNMYGYEYFLPNTCGMLKKARGKEIKKVHKEGQIYIESSHFLSMFILDLYKLYPNALFIHLIRDGREVVRSGLNWGWYKMTDMNSIKCTTQGNIWGVNGWYAPAYCKTRFTKACNYWNMQNAFINNSFVSIPKEQQLVIKLEDNNLKPLCDKLGVDIPKWKISNDKHGNTPHFKDWEENDKKIGMKIMKAGLKKYGYI